MLVGVEYRECRARTRSDGDEVVERVVQQQDFREGRFCTLGCARSRPPVWRNYAISLLCFRGNDILCHGLDFSSFSDRPAETCARAPAGDFPLRGAHRSLVSLHYPKVAFAGPGRCALVALSLNLKLVDDMCGIYRRHAEHAGSHLYHG